MSKQYCSVYKFLEDKHPQFLEIVDKLCLDGMFKKMSGRTFLVPNADLISKISKQAPMDAVVSIKKLILYGVFNDVKELKIDTTNTMKEVVEDLDTLKKNMKSKIVHNIWDRPDKIVLFEYDGKDVPKYSNTKSKSKDKSGGNHDNNTFTFFKKLTCGMNKNFKGPARIAKYASEVSKLFVYVKNNNLTIYNSILSLLDNNPIVTWYILVEPNVVNKHILPCNLLTSYKSNYSVYGELPLPYGKLFEEINTTDIQQHMLTVKKIRDELLKEDTGINLPSLTKEVYNQFMEKQTNEKLTYINDIYKKNKDLKLYHDEIRYLASKDNKFFTESEMIGNLDNYTYNQDNENLLLCNNKLYSHLIGASTLLDCLGSFIRSTTFLYMPMNSEMREKYAQQISGGSISGGVVTMTGGSYHDGGIYAGDEDLF